MHYPTFKTEWPLFVWLIATAIVYAYIGKLVLLVAAIYFLFKGWMWLGRRHPHVAWFIIGFIRGLR